MMVLVDFNGSNEIDSPYIFDFYFYIYGAEDIFESRKNQYLRLLQKFITKWLFQLFRSNKRVIMLIKDHNYLIIKV